MRVSQVKIRDILGIESLDISPGSVTTLEGANATGKSSVLDAIRTAFDGSHDATLIRQGAEQGEVVLVLDDGTEVTKTIRPESSSISVVHPQFGRIGKPATFLRKLSDALSLNPIEFLTAAPKERVDLLLKAVPMELEASQLDFVPVAALEGTSLDGHALEVIGRVGRSIYDLRTGVNRAAREKEATARQMAGTLPADPPEGDWSQMLHARNEEYRKLQRDTAATVATIDGAAAADAKAVFDRYLAHKEEVISETNAAIDRLKADAQVEIERSRAEADEATKGVEEIKRQGKAELEARYRPREAELRERIGAAKAMIEQQAKARTTREFIARLEAEAKGHEAEAAKLTQALARLEALKASLLERLPIEGLSIQDGDIHVGGIPYDRVNEGKRIRLAIEIARLRAGSLGLVAVDGLERLDPKTFEAFKKEAARSKLQFVIAKVTSDEALTVRTENGKEVA